MPQLAQSLSPFVACIRLAMKQFGVISRQQVLDLGLSAAALKRACAAGRFERMLPGVYRVPGTPRGWQQRLMAALLWSQGKAVLSHRSAAALLRLDDCPPGIVELVTTESLRPPCGWIIVHRVSEILSTDVIKVEGFRITSATRTIVDLAKIVDQDTLEIAMESALRRKLTTIPKLNLEVRRRRPGSTAMKRLLNVRGEWAAHTDSALETRTLQVLRKGKFPPPVRQHPITGARRKKFLDLAYPHVNFFMEVQSFEHHSGRRPWNHDQIRLNELHGLGWHGLMVTEEYLTEHTDEFLGEVAKALGVKLF